MKHTGSELPVLIGQSGPLNGEHWIIKDTLTIGRDANCEVVVPDRQVSRYHAQIHRKKEGVFLEDLGSKNGTFCNGKNIQGETPLQDGDILQIALVQSLAFYSSDATLPLEPIRSLSKSTKRLRIDQRARRVWVNNEEVIPPLSAPQFRLMETLYEAGEEVVTRQNLILAIWEDQEAIGISEQALDALVRRLRDRLSLLDSSHTYIVTVRGHGLRLENPDSE